MDIDGMPTAHPSGPAASSPEGRCLLWAAPPPNKAAREPDAPFIIDGDYLTPGSYDHTFERSGLTMRFVSRTFPLESYSRALEAAGFAIELLREPAQRHEAVKADPPEARWQRLPNFLFLRALKIGGMIHG